MIIVAGFGITATAERKLEQRVEERFQQLGLQMVWKIAIATGQVENMLPHCTRRLWGRNGGGVRGSGEM